MQSAKTNMNVEEVFFSIAKDIKQRLAESDTKAEVKLVFVFIDFFLISLSIVDLLHHTSTCTQYS